MLGALSNEQGAWKLAEQYSSTLKRKYDDFLGGLGPAVLEYLAPLVPPGLAQLAALMEATKGVFDLASFLKNYSEGKIKEDVKRVIMDCNDKF